MNAMLTENNVRWHESTGGAWVHHGTTALGVPFFVQVVPAGETGLGLGQAWRISTTVHLRGETSVPDRLTAVHYGDDAYEAVLAAEEVVHLAGA